MYQIIIKIDLTGNDAFTDDELGEVLRIVKTAGGKIERNYDQLLVHFKGEARAQNLLLWITMVIQPGAFTLNNG